MSALKTFAAPIFLLQAEKLVPDRLQLYKLESKNGRREILWRLSVFYFYAVWL